MLLRVCNPLYEPIYHLGIGIREEVSRGVSNERSIPSMCSCPGGIGRIRTHGPLPGSTVFKTVALGHSATIPSAILRLVCRQLRVAITTYEPKIDQSIIIILAIDVIKNQWHRLSLPQGSYSTASTLIRDELLLEDSRL